MSNQEEVKLDLIEKTQHYDRFKLANLHKDSINSIEINHDSNVLYTCSDEQLYLTNLNTSSKFCLYETKDSELSSLKYQNFENKNSCLFVSNSNTLLLFDLNHLKQVSKFKFNKDSINSIEINHPNNLIACCDDSGEIKLIDLRLNQDPSLIKLTLRKTLSKHSNICFCLKFNPYNDNEFFSGSFDCSIIRWDIRFNSKNKNKPYVDSININELLSSSLNSSSASILMSTMTPCFVHNIHFNQFKSNRLLMCGIENGLCILFDINSNKLKYMGHEQLQLPNLALTQFVDFQHTIKVSQQTEIDNPIAVAGNGKKLQFIKLRDDQSNIKIEIINELNIDHKYKINCLKYYNKKLYLADTSNALSIYEYF